MIARRLLPAREWNFHSKTSYMNLLIPPVCCCCCCWSFVVFALFLIGSTLHWIVFSLIYSCLKYHTTKHHMLQQTKIFQFIIGAISGPVEGNNIQSHRRNCKLWIYNNKTWLACLTQWAYPPLERHYYLSIISLAVKTSCFQSFHFFFPIFGLKIYCKHYANEYLLWVV